MDTNTELQATTSTPVAQWMDRRQAAEYLGMTHHWLNKHAGSIDHPKFIRHGMKCWYRRDDLDDWMRHKDRVMVAGAGGRSELEVLREMGERKRARKPTQGELEQNYRIEYGRTPSERDAKAAKLFKALMKTLNAQQQMMLEQLRAC